jgi:hypothetical protein
VQSALFCVFPSGTLHHRAFFHRTRSAFFLYHFNGMASKVKTSEEREHISPKPPSFEPNCQIATLSFLHCFLEATVN